MYITVDEVDVLGTQQNLHKMVSHRQSITITVVLIVLQFKTTNGQSCRSSVNASVFEEQLGHLHYHEREVQFRNISYLYEVDDELCDRASIASPMLLPERSVCPWQIVRDVNEHRYPPVLNIARCRCSRCLGHNECRPVTYRIPVLEKICFNGIYQYIKSYATVPVGCICVRPRVLQVKKRLLLDLLRQGNDVRRLNMKIYDKLPKGQW